MRKTLNTLGPCASRQGLLRAVAENHVEWFGLKARSSGGELDTRDGVVHAVHNSNVTILFPRVSSSQAASALDSICAEARHRGVKAVSCWSMSPTKPKDLGALAAARGFEWGWRPHWMALDLASVSDQQTLPTNLKITIDDGVNEVGNGIPYYDAAEIARMHTADANGQFYHFLGWLNGRLVAHSVVLRTVGPYGVGGVYNVGVHPSARGRGIGCAISLAAASHAKELGCNYAMLNSAADELYEKIGFVSLGHGQTWWMHSAAIDAGPPDRRQIAFVEAICRGDAGELESLPRDCFPADLDSALPNGMTPIELASAARTPRSVRWLAEQGATLDILNAWDLGWTAVARKLLKVNPSLANRRTGSWQTVPLHTAAMRGDTELARLILSAQPELTIQDAEFHSTPLGWAKHFDRHVIVRLIEEHMGQ